MTEKRAAYLKRFREYSKSRVGPLSTQWKGGITPIHRAVRTMTEYREWRTAVFERDDYTCRSCGIKGGKLQADHLIPFSEILKVEKIQTTLQARDSYMLWKLDNGRTLCIDCHKLTPTYIHGWNKLMIL